MAAGNEGAAGLIGKAELSGTMDFGSSASAAAQGGNIKTGAILNTSGGNFGIVKMLAIAGVALIALRILKDKK